MSYKKTALSLLTAALFTQAASAADIWIEAESGAEYNPMVVKADKGASDAIFLGPWKDTDYNTATGDDARILFDFYAPTTGTYKLWARVKHTQSVTGVNPYWINFDAASWPAASEFKRWDSESFTANTWKWIESGQSFTLTAGKHRLRLAQATSRALGIDKILLTDSGTVPSGLGVAEGKPNVVNPYAATAVSTNGNLYVSGGQLKNKSGTTFQIKGVSLHGLQWFPTYTKQTIPSTAQFFGANAVRLAMYVESHSPTDTTDYWGGYLADKTLMKARTLRAIDDAIAAGMYVLVDWHIHSNPASYTAEAKAFFTEIAQKYGHLPNIIYEICNEPVGADWSSTIKPYAKTIVDTIRAIDPDNIILVGTPNFSQQLQDAVNDPLVTSTGALSKNVMYTMHYYAASHDFNEFTRQIQLAIDKKVPVFISEWGSSDYGVSTSNFDKAKIWVDYLNTKKISWVNWSLGNKDEASSMLKANAPLYGPWGSGDLTPAGAWIKPYFAN
jgi:hypothetical protein